MLARRLTFSGARKPSTKRQKQAARARFRAAAARDGCRGRCRREPRARSDVGGRGRGRGALSRRHHYEASVFVWLSGLGADRRALELERERGVRRTRRMHAGRCESRLADPEERSILYSLLSRRLWLSRSLALGPLALPSSVWLISHLQQQA
ncbi:hypothetical protein BDV96DRAFT_269780 [Lophiotrema nucula]|uniref:Uncharacterized protein n=1 Tax=Lophiotrema nucula TaxID=690887 RepID=A0A6A5ZLQ4_9PLEO|nr:hypothetical protein BDV96DRAFT_269780 [Lophiotrema nucula]